MRIGSTVYIRYKDHALFRNVDARSQRPIIQEAVGWLDLETEDFVRVLLTRYRDPKIRDGPAETKATGLVILRSTILEMRKIA